MHDFVAVAQKISALEKKHIAYFSDKDFKLRNCVLITFENPPSAHIINHQLPFDIEWDIVTMFWFD